MTKNITRTSLVLCLIFSAGWVLAQDWNEYKQQHFIIYYKNAPLDFVKTVERSGEQYYNEITENLGFTRYKGWSWDNRAKIYIFDDSDDYVKSGKQAGWSHGAASPEDRIIRTFPSAYGFFDTVLPHELGHIIFREFIGFRGQIPTWFDEGVAMYQEKAKRWGAHKAVSDAIVEGTFIPLKELSATRLRPGTDDKMVELFYNEAASIVNFLISEYGDDRFVRFCRKLKEGDDFYSAMAAVYVRIKTVEELNDVWVRYLKNNYSSSK